MKQANQFEWPERVKKNDATSSLLSARISQEFSGHSISLRRNQMNKHDPIRLGDRILSANRTRLGQLHRKAVLAASSSDDRALKQVKDEFEEFFKQHPEMRISRWDEEKSGFNLF